MNDQVTIVLQYCLGNGCKQSIPDFGIHVESSMWKVRNQMKAENWPLRRRRWWWPSRRSDSRAVRCCFRVRCSRRRSCRGRSGTRRCRWTCWWGTRQRSRVRRGRACSACSFPGRVRCTCGRTRGGSACTFCCRAGRCRVRDRSFRCTCRWAGSGRTTNTRWRPGPSSPRPNTADCTLDPFPGTVRDSCCSAVGSGWPETFSSCPSWWCRRNRAPYSPRWPQCRRGWFWASACSATAATSWRCTAPKSTRSSGGRRSFRGCGSRTGCGTRGAMPGCWWSPWSPWVWRTPPVG